MMYKSDRLNEIFTKLYKNPKVKQATLDLVSYIEERHSTVDPEEFNQLAKSFKFSSPDITKCQLVQSIDHSSYYFLGKPDEVMKKFEIINPNIFNKTLVQQAKIAYTKIVKIQERFYKDKVPEVLNKSYFLTGGRFQVTSEPNNDEIIEFLFANKERCYPPNNLVIKTLILMMKSIVRACEIKNGLPPLEFFQDRNILQNPLAGKFLGYKFIQISPYNLFIKREYITDDLIKEAYKNIQISCIMEK